MGLYRFFFIQMVFRYAKGLGNQATRLWFAPVGPVAVAAGVYSAIAGGPPPLTVAGFVAGSSIMRIQAAMVERAPWKSLRNGGLLVIVLMVAMMVILREFLWTSIGLAIGLGLLALHRQHEAFLADRGLAAGGDLTYAEQLARFREATPSGE